ncbi:hypothetical protein BGZ95_000953 [Linnemannia exigua]|uniref:F-box domain-containing protein n=1 Tax=Linnemannia exigua TaxID=604196 RepID=A0AAD4H8V8_9FUNG|nr:hypothetical protein BGZ95_000953 [Linnemannia exigua]
MSLPGISSPSTSGPTSPFEIPEILTKILSNVEQHTLRRSVPFVCRQWLQISRPYILRTVYWGYEDQLKDDKALEERLRRLQFADRLEIEVNHRNSGVKWYWFAELVARARMAPKKDLKQPGEGEEFLNEGGALLLRQRPLRELSMVGWAASDILARMFVCLGSLTHLEVMDTSARRWSRTVERGLLDPCGIFRCCPLLQYLKMSSDLEELLSVSPRMKVLKVINREVTTPDGSSIFAQRYYSYTLNDLQKHLDKIGLVLETFHYSDHHLGLFNLDHTKTLQRYSKSKEWTFVEGDLSPKLVQELQTIPNVVTTLELLNVTNYFTVVKGLHNYLCSSPHLVHLRAAKTPYPVELMDVHDNYLLGWPKKDEKKKLASTGSGGGEGVDKGDDATAEIETDKQEQDTKEKEQEREKEKRQGRKGIWTCRNLETLHLGFRTISSRPSPKRNSLNARIVFGYLSRVCPQLRVLHLQDKDCRHTTAFPYLSLKTGFVLLSRLQHLRQLRIGTFDQCKYPAHGPQYFADELSPHRNWMFIGRKEKLKYEPGKPYFDSSPYERRTMVMRWKSFLQRDDEMVLAREVERMNLAWQEDVGTEGSNSDGEAEAEEDEEMSELRGQLKNVGLLRDVFEMVREMDTTTGFVSCPSLEQFRCISPREYGAYPTF